ncbi:MAG TPA: hypothetical protein VHL59_09420 [Thermoanaerobaculia bacterium]|nr:hypothetical protein [Thermoanaerobaculia bacterium]
MNHLTQEEIVLSYYGEPERADHVAHLADCEQCQTELGRVAQVLERVTLDVPEPEADFEQRMWQRVSWRLRGEKKHDRRAQWTKWLAAAAVFAVAFVSGLLWNRSTNRPTGDPARVAETSTSTTEQLVDSEEQQQQGRDRILFVVVSNHFEQSERVLVELTNLTLDGDTDITAERERAGALLASNRLYRRTAQERGEESVATLLDELEPVLMQIAHAPSQASADELRAIQKRVEAKGLVFKLRVVRADVRATSSAVRAQQQPNI